MTDYVQLEFKVHAFYCNVRGVMFEPGNWVRYVPTHAHDNVNHRDCQDGVVKRYASDGKTVFVLYDNKDRKMMTPDEPYTAQGTNRDDLVLMGRRRDQRKGVPPIETRTPGPRKRKPIQLAHIDTPVNVPRSLLLPLATLQRCIMAGSGIMANNRQWLEIERKHTNISLSPSGRVANARITTADGRRWLVTAEEVEV